MNLSGGPFDYFIAFVGGFILSFTPCVYPLIPISVSFIGINAGGSKLKGFILSLIYVLGIAVTYSVLGIAAMLSGKIFGAISNHPVSYIVVGSVIVIFGLSMFGFFNFSLPNFVKTAQFKKKNYFSTFLLGLTSGLVISPCVTPVLASILMYLTAQKSLIYGASLLFVFAFGMGVIFIAAGVFSSLLLSLPKSGRWMGYIQKVCAAILVIIGIYFVFIGIGRANPAFAGQTQLASDFRLHSLKQDAVTLSSFREKKPVLLLFWTTWCPFCREQLMWVNDKYPQYSKQGLEILPINVGESAERVEKFVSLRNLTLPFLLDIDSSVAGAFGVMGVPTYILIDIKGYIVLKSNSFPEKEAQALFQNNHYSATQN